MILIGPLMIFISQWPDQFIIDSEPLFIGPDWQTTQLGWALFLAAGIWILVMGILSLIGGILSVQKKGWGMALTGSITSILGGSFLLGILSLVFVAISKREFKT